VRIDIPGKPAGWVITEQIRTTTRLSRRTSVRRLKTRLVRFGQSWPR